MRSRFAVALLTSLLVSACGGGSTGPGIQPQIANAPDNFQYQVSSVSGYSGVLTYQWSNTGTQANVNQSTTVTGGSVIVTLLDANGVQVYQRSLADNGTFTSNAGTAGTWTIRVDYSGMSGTVNFRVQKKT